MTPLEHALAYAALGWRVAPIPPGYKYPHGFDDWEQRATTDVRKVRWLWTQHPDFGVCIATGPGSGVVAIDIDSYNGGDDGWAELERIHGPAPETVEAVTGGGGRHLLYLHPGDGGPPITNAAHALPPGIDVRGEGGQIVVAPTIHPTTGARYVWEVEHDPLQGFAVAAMPAWLVALLRTPAPQQTARADRAPYTGGDSIVDRFAADHTWPDLLVPAGWQFHSARLGYEMWTRPGKEVRDGASATLYWAGSDVLKVHTKMAPPLGHLETYTRFGFFAAMHHGGDHRAAASAYRREVNGSALPVSAPSPRVTKPEAPQVGTRVDDGTDDTLTAGGGEEPGGQPHSDLGNARRLVAAHGHDLRHAPQWGTWLVWDGHRWAEDVTGEATRRAKAVVDSMVTELATIADDATRKKLFGHWMRSQGASRLEAMTTLARTEPGIPVTVAELDADPWVFNTWTGTIDLRTGQTDPAERRHLVTKLAPVSFNPDAGCPTWRWFIDWAMCGDAELVAFLQRAVGYSLTGLVAEHCLFFLHGNGANGKSTFLNVLQRLAGDYAIAAEADLLLATNHDRHSTGIADLVGRRLVVVQETDEGRRLAEATVKQLTGGDTIRARRMRQDNFEFRPSHKLWMAANHRPQVRGTDHGIWRRIRMIPFLAAVEPGAQDPQLLDRLLMELPGILNWALEGCRQWMEGGLRPPAAVLAATQDYRTEQDHVGRFVDECCVLDDTLCVTARDLRATYERWCEENGERPWSAKAMGPQLVDRGLSRVQDSNTKGWTWVGISLSDNPQSASASMLIGRMAQLNGPVTGKGVAHPAHPAHSEWAGGKSDLPGQTSVTGPSGPLPYSPIARAHTGVDTENGPDGPVSPVGSLIDELF